MVAYRPRPTAGEKNQAEALAKLDEAHNPDARRLLDYLNRTPSNRWAAVLPRLPELRELANLEPEAAARYARNVLMRVEIDPVPTYEPVENSPRVFSVGGSVLHLPRKIRKALISWLGWHSLDLAHAQLSIVAKVWGVAPLQDYLREGKSFWADAINCTGLDADQKDFLKTSLYSLVFGAGEARMQRDWIERYGDARGRELYGLWMRHPVVAALLSARGRVMKEIEARGYAEDAYGHRWEVETWTATNPQGGTYPATNVRSLMACQAQSYELALLAPILDIIAEQGDKVRLAFWLHDGIGVSCPEDRSYVLQQMVKRVNARARELGIITRLEIEG